MAVLGALVMRGRRCADEREQQILRAGQHRAIEAGAAMRTVVSLVMMGL